MRLSIITINYNGAEKTNKLFDSLKNQTDQDFNVFVLDNASEKSDFEKLNLTTSDVVRSEQNLGFGGGINLLAKKALGNGSDRLLILNNDVTLDPDFMGLLRVNLKPENDIVGIPLDEGERTAYAGKIRWLKHTLP